MFSSNEAWKKYVQSTYVEVTDSRLNESHWDLLCTSCKVTRGFQVTQRINAGVTTEYGTFQIDHLAPVTYVFRCPVCKNFKQWIIFVINRAEMVGGNTTYKDHFYKVTSIPNEGLEDIEEMPQDPPSLRIAYRQAIRAMDANANLAAAAMFRRALQIITRDLLGATPGNLANELREVVGRSHSGGTITSTFSDVGYIIKEAGNQGAHPDKDPDLIGFTPNDAEDLQRIFMEMVSELFVIPAASRKAKEDFLARRKISSASSPL